MDNSSKIPHNIVTMSKNKLHNAYAPLSLVEAYWDALRAGREMPKRAEIDPRGIESALEHAFILERVAPGVARMRIAGTHLHDVLGMEARGMPLTSFFEQDDRIQIAGLLEEVFQTPGTADVVMHSSGSLGQPQLEARMVLMPLKSDLGDVSRILGCFVCVGDLGAVPRRFTLRETNFQRLDSAPVRSPNKAEAMQGFAETQKLFQPPVTTDPKRPPYLRLVKTDT